MTRCVGLLRAVNVGGRNVVAMDDLCRVFDGLGFSDVRTVAQTGNVVFATDDPPPADLAQRIEAAIVVAHPGLATSFLVRTAGEWAAIVSGNPLPDVARDDPSHLLVMFLRDVPDAAARASVAAGLPGREVVRVVGREVFVAYPDGIGRSKVTNAFLERRLGTVGTARNWNTVLRVDALLREPIVA